LTNVKPENSPLKKLEYFSKLFKIEVYGKLELFNPTGSHKDRESYEVLKDAEAKGFNAVGCASTGNAAISLAAYSFMKNLKCHIYVSEKVNPEKLNLIEMFHPEIHVVKGNYEDAIRKSNEEMRIMGIYNANPGKCKAKIIGNMKIGFEIAEKIKPTYVICPTNNGTHISGVWLGLKSAGLKPVMIAAVAKETKVADSIAGFHKLEGKILKETLKESEGFIVNVSDEEIIETLRLLVKKEGIIAEPASAAPLATLNRIELNPGDIVCCTITGLGLRLPKTMKRVLFL